MGIFEDYQQSYGANNSNPTPNPTSGNSNDPNSVGIFSDFSKSYGNPMTYKPIAEDVSSAVTNTQSKGFWNGLLDAAGYVVKKAAAGLPEMVGGLERTASFGLKQLSNMYNDPNANEQENQWLQQAQELRKQGKVDAAVKLEDMAKKSIDYKKMRQTQFSDTSSKLMTNADTQFSREKIYTDLGLPIEDPKKFSDAIKDPKYVLGAVAEGIPTLAANIGLAALTGAVTKNPAIALEVAFASNYAQAAGDTYDEALHMGANEQTAAKAGYLTGVANGVLNILPINEVLQSSSRGPIAKELIKKEISKQILKQTVIGTGSASIQQIVTNAIAQTYDKNRSLFDGVPMTLLVSGITSVGLGGVDAKMMSDQNFTTEEIKQHLNKQIDEALRTPEAKRNEQQKALLGTKAKVTDNNPEQKSSVVDTVIKYENADKFAEEAYGVTKEAKIGNANVSEFSNKNQNINGEDVQNILNVLSQPDGLQPIRAKVTDAGKLEAIPEDVAKLTAYKVMGASDVPVIITEGNKPGFKSLEEVYTSVIDTNKQRIEAMKKGSGLYGKKSKKSNTTVFTKEEQAQIDAVKTQLEPKIKAAEDYNQEFDTTVRDIGKQFGYQTEVGPAKGLKRAAEKVALEEGGKIETLKDYNRATFKVDNPSALLVKDGENVTLTDNLRNQIETKLGKITRIKDNFTNQDGGFKKIIINFETKNGNIAEIQLTTPEMYKAKMELGGHELYDIVRVKAKGWKQAEDYMNKLYSVADEAFNLRSNSSLDNSTPSNKALTGGNARPEGNTTPVTSASSPSPEASTRTNLSSTSKNLGNGLEDIKSPPSDTSIPNTAEKVNSNEMPQDKLPIGEGKIRESELYRRSKQAFEEYAQNDATYQRLNLADDAENAVKYVQDNHIDALRVARGLQAPPKGITDTAISLAVIEKLKMEGKTELASQLMVSLSKRMTREGQNIAALRGRIDENSPQAFINEVVSRRLESIGKTYKEKAIDLVNATNAKKSSKENAFNRINEDASKINEVITKQRNKLQLAQEIIEALKCK